MIEILLLSYSDSIILSIHKCSKGAINASFVVSKKKKKNQFKRNAIFKTCIRVFLSQLARLVYDDCNDFLTQIFLCCTIRIWNRIN